MSGKVYLVGAGPGDPRLLTLRALELLERADVVAVDALVSPGVLATIRSGARIIETGKRAGSHSMSQEQINDLLVAESRRVATVVRLKGGDPFVFGRGGEEAERLSAEGIEFEVVPGISSAIAGPAYAGIPVTHRSIASSVTLITAHESDDSRGVDFSAVAALDGTLVFLMGLGNLEIVSRRLIEHGRSASTPVAVISRATTAQQRTITGTLGTIVQRVGAIELPPPALIVVGDVVRLRDAINWFESRPLFGKTIIVTRARSQASDLSALLAGAGAHVIELPTIAILPPSSYDSLDRVISGSFDWIVFTSVNGVESFFLRLFDLGKDCRSLAQSKIAAVGSTTASLLAERGIRADLIPERFQSDALLDHFELKLGGMRIAIVRAEKGRDQLIDTLRERGASVDLGVAYRTTEAEQSRNEVRTILTDGRIDVVTFTSTSTVENFFDLVTASDRERHLGGVIVASIGPVTSEAIRSAGGRVDLEAESATVPHLAEAVIRHFRPLA